MDIYYIDAQLTPHFREQMKSLGLVNGMPFTLSDDFKFDSEINAFFWQLPTPRRKSRESWKTYAEAISMYMRFLEAIGIHWRNVTKKELQTYHRVRRHTNSDDLKPVSSSTWKRDITAIKLLYEWAFDEELIKKIPFKLSEVSAVPGSPMQSATTTDLHEKVKHKDLNYLHVNDYKERILPTFVDARNAVRNEAISKLLISTGVRIEEAHIFKLTALPDPDAKKYKGRKSCTMRIVGKGNKQRTIRIPKHVLRDIYNYIETDRQDACDRFLEKHPRKKNTSEYLWLTESGNHIGKRMLQKIIEDAGKKAGIRLHPHMFRHTFAIFQLSAMIRTTFKNEDDELKLEGDLSKYKRIYQDPLRQLQKLMGHSHISSTFIYLDYLDETDEMVDVAIGDWTDSLYENLEKGEIE